MHYTENYHLPQWVKSDRIMMDDFNRMCADIDAGLSRTAQATEEASQTGDARNKLLTDRLLRLTYNQYVASQSIDPFPQLSGMFYQNAVRDLDSNAGTSWNGVRYMGSGEGSFVAESFFQQCTKSISNLVLDKNNPANCKPLEMEIYVPITTMVRKFNLCGSISNNVPNTPAPFLVTLKNLGTGEIEQSFQLDLRTGSVSIVLVDKAQPANLYFFSGCRYLLRMEPIGNPVFNADLMIGPSVDTRVDNFATINKTLSLSYTMREEASSSMGLLFLKCRAGGATGQLTVKWDGKTMTPVTVRQYRNAEGLDLWEMIYMRKEPIPAETAFSVNFQCGANGGIWFQDWGAFLL